MKFIKSLVPIVRLYQFCGFVPFSVPFVNKKDVPKWKFYIHSGVLTVFFFILFLYNIVSMNTFIGDEESKLLAYLSVIIVTLMRALAVIIMVESILKRHLHIEILSRIDSVDRIFRNELATSLDYKKMQRNAIVWMGIWQIQIFTLLSLIVYTLFEVNMSIWMKLFWIFCSCPIFISSMRYYQIIHYIRLLGFCFETFNIQLNQIYANTNRLSKNKELPNVKANSARKSIYENIVSLRRLYHVLWECTGLLNKCFQWSLLLLIAASFFTIIINCYRTLLWVLVPGSSDIGSAVTFLVWAGGHAFYFIKLSSTCHLISTQLRTIPIQLHNVAYKILDHNINNLV